MAPMLAGFVFQVRSSIQADMARSEAITLEQCGSSAASASGSWNGTMVFTPVSVSFIKPA